ncbi:pyrophosphatase PpaX [Halalkalibacterium halodurans]|uniref:pyrophosphatase PpaX n=1 Tax=Halalkalibacterium halodurans TaxID=86665 RepID=UPI002AA9BEAC|nr:pyrophosphatase PpaX [Halalkalibacterium halodurans]MDY7224064.1 pyrophosphatase PpaX [Halalkalibacterium halodurans]MDY7243349.1 pyrophosphatase PpaX [Halalkalibacterium halodurans]
MEINTVLFDLDGTLINTNELIISSFLHTFETYYPGKYGRKDAIECIGPPLTDSFKRLDPERVEEMVATYRKHNHAHHDKLVEPYEGVYETVKTLHEQGFKLAIVTTKIRETAMKGLKLFGLDEFFDVIVALDDVENVKPNPEPLEKAMNGLGAKKEETIMVGDNSHDILGGKNAGVKTAVVGYAIRGEDYVRQFDPDYVLRSMPDLLDIVGVKAR